MNRFEGHLSKVETNEIIGMLNAEKSNSGNARARTEWQMEMRAELRRRGIDCSAIERSGGRFRLEGPKLVRDWLKRAGHEKRLLV